MPSPEFRGIATRVQGMLDPNIDLGITTFSQCLLQRAGVRGTR